LGFFLIFSLFFAVWHLIFGIFRRFALDIPPGSPILSPTSLAFLLLFKTNRWGSGGVSCLRGSGKPTVFPPRATRSGSGFLQERGPRDPPLRTIHLVSILFISIMHTPEKQLEPIISPDETAEDVKELHQIAEGIRTGMIRPQIKEAIAINTVDTDVQNLVSE
jgi:hypothetical protein